MSNGYDLGRKVIYFTIVAIVIAVMMVYVSNALYKIDSDITGHFGPIGDYLLSEKIAKCVSLTENLDACLEDGTTIELDGIKVGDGDVEKEYKKIILYKGKLKVLKIGI